MMSALKLWQQRVDHFWSEAIRHLRYVTNSGFLFFLILLVLVGGYYYARILQTLPDSFPVRLIMVTLFTLLLSGGAVRTFLQTADQLFLLPYELELGPYFRRAFYYSYRFQVGVLTAVLFLVWPLYQTVAETERWSFLLVWFVLVLLKGFNTWMVMQENRLRSRLVARSHQGGRLVINGMLLYFFFAQEEIWVGIWFLFLLGVVFFHYRHLQQLPLNWDWLIQKERRMVVRFYTIVNWFVDVPQLQAQVHRRSWLSSLAQHLAFQEGKTYSYYLHLVFYRSHDLFPLYFRLTIVMALLLGFLPVGLMTAAVYLLSILLIGMQISPLYGRVHDLLWLRLYPQPMTQLVEAYVQLVKKHVFISAIILAIPVVILAFQSQLYWLLLVPPIGWWIGSQWYLKKRLNPLQ
ncbi:ABC transporter permease [Rubeoparvulum massiliense]|uniref:ABC transporter permease n=1 Tax=Rubeoparvulum massiliense TaxID=1631346 RepID=UPI00065E1D0D|nr:ABC transporter permease [Rubeoparvulum massiliense]